MIQEDLRAWFGKGKEGGVGGGGWDRYNSSGDRVGKCGDAKEGDPYSACLSKEKARKLGKAGRAAFVKRKRAAQKKGGDAKKGGERSKGQKPIKVKTGVKENISVDTAYDKIDRMPQGKIFDDAKRIDGIFNKSKHSYSEVIEAFEKNKAKNNFEFVSVKDVHITQPNIQSNKVKQMIDNFTKLPPINVVQFQDGEMSIYDGHHRLTATWALGKNKIKVNLVKTGINEIGEASISPYKYKVSYTDGNIYKTDGYQEYEFDTDAGTNYGVQVSNKEGYLVIEFVTAAGYDLTNEKEPFKIMSTVTSIIKGILEKDKGNYLKGIQYVLSPEKGIDRDRLYRTFIKKQRPGTTFKETGSWNNELVTATFPRSKSMKTESMLEKINQLVEKNVPTDPSKWSYYKSQAKKKFDVYPSAYANAWAAKKYKAAGGKWKKQESVTLESTLLSVSAPYALQKGDFVRNINTSCPHYRSTGEVIDITDDGFITYVVNNKGATYTPGMELTKSDDQLIKIFTHTPRPGYGSFTNECVVAKIPVENKTILAKNRDRGYRAEIEIVHELVGGVEMVYLHDKLTDWSEGMNEFGIGIINASLSVNFDEQEGKLAKQNLEKGKSPKVSHDGLKIRQALSKKKLSEAVHSIVSYVGEDEKDVGIKGHTIVANTKHAFVIELTSKHLPVIKKIDDDKILVRTNHGIEYPETGYTKGVKRKSSISRMNVAKSELQKVKHASEVLPTLAKQYTEDNFMNPYRRSNEHNMETTSQIMYNLNDLEFFLNWDIDHSEFKGIVNRLPKGYSPKIKIHVSEID